MPDTENATPVTRFYNMSEEPPLYYVNAWQIKVTNAEATFQFGDIIESTPEEKIVRNSASIVMTHESLVRMADSFQKTLALVQILHGGQLPGVTDVTPEQVKEIETMFPGIETEIS